MSKTLSLILTLIIVGGLALAASGCKSNDAEDPATAAIRAYADPATETTLQGLSQNDLEMYTRYANAEFKAAVTAEILSQAAAQISAQLGEFQGIEFLRTEEQQGYTIVHYQASFSQGEVGVRMVFDQDHLVAGQFFE